MEIGQIALGIGFILSFIMAIALGGNDAASPVANVVGTRILTINQGIFLFAIFSTIGALSQGYMNMKTVGTGIVPTIDLLGAIIIVLVAFTWIMICNNWGLEISVTHTIIGSILGYGLAAFELGIIQWDLLHKVMFSWFASPILAAIVSYLMHNAMSSLSNRYKRIEESMKIILIIALCYSAYAFGANDIANATGVYVTVTHMVMGSPPESDVMFYLAILGSIGVVIGGVLLGPKVINTVAFNIINLNIVSGTAAELTNALVIHLFVTIPYLIIGY